MNTLKKLANNIGYIVLGGAVGLGLLVGVASSAAILQGFQGGTGIGTATSSDVGKFLKVASSSPWLTYTFSSMAGSATTTINDVIGPTFTISIVSTSSASSITTSSANLFLNLLAYTSSTNIEVSSTGTITFKVPSASEGDMAYFNGTSWARVPSSNNTSSLLFLSQVATGTPHWQTVPIAGSFSEYFQNVSSTGLSTYKQMGAATGTMVSISTGAISASTTLMAWLTASSTPGITLIPGGNWGLHIDATKTGTKSVRLYAVVFRYDGTETALFTTQESELVTGTDTLNPQEIDIQQASPDINVSSTSRIGVRWYAVPSGAGTNPNVSVYYQGLTQARVDLPAPSITANNFVPYTGAVKAVDLGAFGLSAATSTFGGSVNTTGTFTESGVPVVLNTRAINTTAAWLTGGGNLTADRTLDFSAVFKASSTAYDAAVTSSSLIGPLVASTTVLNLLIASSSKIALLEASSSLANYSTSTFSFGIGFTSSSAAIALPAKYMTFGGIIRKWWMSGTENCTSSFDVWKATGRIPTTSTSTITGSDVPILNGQQINSSTALTGWTTTFAKGDYIAINATGTASTCGGGLLGLDYSKLAQ